MSNITVKEVYIDNLLELEVRRCIEIPGHRVCVIASNEEEKNCIYEDAMSLICDIRNSIPLSVDPRVSVLHGSKIGFENGGIMHFSQINKSLGKDIYHSVLICPEVSSIAEKIASKLLFPSFGTIARMEPIPQAEPCPEEMIYEFLGITLNERAAE